jgi:hypothetical protein
MIASKKYFVRLCLNLTAMSVLALVACLAVQTTVSASSAKAPRTHTAGTIPDATCDATGGTGCNVTFNGTLAGALAATVGVATITPPTTLNGTAQIAPFTFVTSVADTRGTGASPWALSAASDGLTVSTVSGTETDPFVVTNVAAVCSAASSCSNATVTATAGSLTATAAPYATAPDGGDIGTTDVTVNGNVSLNPDTVGGAYLGTITITAGPTV